MEIVEQSGNSTDESRRLLLLSYDKKKLNYVITYMKNRWKQLLPGMFQTKIILTARKLVHVSIKKMRQNFSTNDLIYHEESPEGDCPNDNIGEINRKIAEKLKTI